MTTNNSAKPTEYIENKMATIIFYARIHLKEITNESTVSFICSVLYSSTVYFIFFILNTNFILAFSFRLY